MTKQTYKIEGIHCASCVSVIELTLSKTKGVKSAVVNFATETALIEFDENIISPAKLAETVESIGYTLKTGEKQSAEKSAGIASNKIASIKVLGMESPHCAMIVEGALKKLSGMQNINVDFSNQRTKVVFDPDSVSLDQIFKVISDAGYKPILEESGAEELIDEEKTERESQLKTLKTKLLIGGILAIFIALGSFTNLSPLLSNGWVLLALTTPVQFWVGSQFYSGLKLLFKYRTSDMNTLVSVGTLSAYLYSAAAIIFPDFFIQSGQKPSLYFDTTAIIIILILLGKYFEILMKGRASEAIKKLIGLQPKTAKILINGKEIETPINEVKVSDKIVVRPGEKIPVDGKIIEGSSEIDESMVTGESMPVHKKIGDSVIGSSINKFGAFTFEATKVGKDTVLSQIIKMVEQAQGSKAPIQKLADSVISYFVPAVFSIAIITFAIWYFFGPSPAFNFALINFVSVLIIACPCALGLATPMAIMVGAGNASKKGILIKDAESFEIANKVNTIILDKTGTITEGKPKLTDILTFDGNEKEILKLASSLEQKSEHPLARAILEGALKEKMELYKLRDFKAVAGKGLTGFLSVAKGKETEIYLGNKSLIKDLKLDISPYSEKITKLESEGKTVMILAAEGKIKGALAVADVVKKEAKEAVSKIKRMGIKVWMITGDNERTAKAIGKEVGIENIMSEVLPNEKMDKIKKLQSEGNIVAMVGDGINDAPALTQANLGIAMGEGTDIAMESSNITLIRGDLNLIPETINLSKRTLSVIKQNLFWAFGYNTVLIPVAAGILYPFYGILLDPMLAAGAMALSSISVVLNSLRLKN
jgi:Cu+-exporting ATPase